MVLSICEKVSGLIPSFLALYLYFSAVNDPVEVSAVTFPAYEDTEINARSKEALENARLALENANRSAEDTNSVDTELELLKAKFYFEKKLGGN